MDIKNTATMGLDRLKMLVYGAPGVGKTTLASTLPGRVLIVSAEAGTLSLAGHSIDVIDVTEHEGKALLPDMRIRKLNKVLGLLNGPDFQSKYDWVFVDSLTEISQTVLEAAQDAAQRLAAETGKAQDGFKLWGDYARTCTALVKAFRDLPGYGVVFTALEAEDKDENGRRFMRVDMQGKVGKQLPAFFDEVFRMSVDSGARALQTEAGATVIAKDRSGRLDTVEPADLGAVVAKIQQQPKKGTSK